ncbi:MAG: hypothetical protein FJX18_02825 [Alphaproteobacteria bacterium]|nr:hypothetical protein [Alphaproteobacteria bacterium]
MKKALVAALVMLSVTTRLLEATILTEGGNNITPIDSNTSNLSYWNTSLFQKKVRQITDEELNGTVPIQLSLN